MRQKLIAAFSMLMLAAPLAQAQTLRIVTVNEASLQADTRIQVGALRQRTDATGSAVLALAPGKYEVQGPRAKAEGYVVAGAETLVVLQEADIQLKSNKVFLGSTPYEGASFSFELSYETPLNYPVTLTARGVPAAWRLVFDSSELKPDTKTTVTIHVPEGSKDFSEAIQIVGSVGSVPVAATTPMRISRGWRDKPLEIKKDALKEVLPLNITLQTSRSQGDYGVAIDSDIDLAMRSILNDKITGIANMRFTHAWSPQDRMSEISLRLANLTYQTGLVNITVGRLDLAPLLRPGEFFGSYLTLGQRRFDGLFLLLPLNLYGTAGVDAQGFQLPPTSVSVGYFPNFFSFLTDTLDYNNGYVIGSIKMPLPIAGNPLTFGLQMGNTTNWQYIYSSPLSGNPGASASINYNYSRNYDVFTEFAIGNIADIDNTAALMTGARAKNLRAFTLGILDAISVEYQIPLIQSEKNPFIGGNQFFPDEASVSQGAWYLKARTSFDGLVLTAALTNSVGDWTFARPAANAFDTYRTFNLNDLRSANEVDDTGKQLLAGAYEKIAFLLTVKAEF